MAGIKTHRIAIRTENGMVNAYWAPIDSMEGAELVASCAVEVLDDDPNIVQGFYLLMQMASIALCKSRLGVTPKAVEFTVDAALDRAKH